MDPRPLITADLDLYGVLERLAPLASAYLEIGTKNGASLRAVLTANPDLARVVCCDTWQKRRRDRQPATHAHIEALLAEMGWTGDRGYLDGRSTELVPQLEETFDLILIDGGHSFETARDDLEHCFALATRFIVIDDIHLRPPVWTAVRDFCVTKGPALWSTMLVTFSRHGQAILERRR